ncbi:MAG: hypothetical protein EA424_05995 [Planctomycetaceae bacterium]|nr:MAG: hypothetical protein EA424_05995 [Planctomycetaceae bacterium]
MRFADESYNLRIELDTKNCTLSRAALEKMEEALAPLREPVHTFPVSDFYITVVYHSTPEDYHVRVSMVLPGRTLFTGERDSNPVSAFSRCVRKLVSKLKAYKDSLEAKPQKTKAREGTVQEVVPEAEPDADQLRNAIAERDYDAFRRATYVYEEAVRKRAGRWIERYPDFEARLGAAFTLEDLVEEVFLNAFEYFDRWPDELRLGEWLENLIDPSVKALLKDPEAELANLDAVRTYRETVQEQD